MSKTEILDHAAAIVREYQASGLQLTVRQIYYQFVARGLLESGQRVYKRLVKILTDARYSGELDLDAIEDRTRTCHPGHFTRDDRNAAVALDRAASWIQSMPRALLARDRWFGQDTHVSVWVEKEALAGIFEPICDELGVSWMACKGSPSVSALWRWIKSANTAADWMTDDHVRHVILYFGDHDPTGFMIPRSAQDGIDKLCSVSGHDVDLEVRRVALNMDQVQRYSPPPFWAKTTDSRFEGYVREHDTQEAWELDALEPTVLRSLVRDEVNALFDYGVHEELAQEIADERERLRELMADPEWMEMVLDGI